MANKKPFRVRDRETKRIIDIYFPGQDVNVNTDGTFKSLSEALDELQEEIGEAGTGNYTKPPGGIPYSDLSQGVRDTLDDVANKVTQETGKGLSTNDYTTEEKTKLAGLSNYNDAELRQQITRLQTALDNLMNGESVTDAIDTFAEVTAFLNGINADDETLAAQLLALDTAIKSVQQSLLDKANTEDVARDYATKGELSGKLSQSDVSVETQGDGTVDIIVGSGANKDNYKINLNHTHEGMAKLVVCEESELPSTLANDTIYGVKENGGISKMYLSGFLFSSRSPETGEARIVSPTPGVTLDMGVDVGNGFSKTIRIIAKNISQALTIAISGTSGTWGINYGQLTGQSSITIPAADALLGVNIEITCTPSSNTVDEATLVISSTEITTTSLNLEAQNVSIVDLAAVKFTRQQYVETDIHPGPDTRLEIDMKFDGNYVIPDKVTTDVNFIGGGTDNGKTFSANVKSDVTTPGVVIYTETTSSNCTLNISSANIENRSTLIINNVSHQASFIGVSGTLPTKTTTMPAKMKFGSNSNGSKPFGAADIILYSLKHYENNVLTHEYLPQSRNGVAGLYDTVTDTFISSSTAVALEAVNS